MSDTVLGVIPAREGSKRIPDKNIREVGGKPLIAHSIEQANAASTIDRCIVSTDGDDIAAVAREYGEEVPFMRPDELATDTASSTGVVEHALNWVESNAESPDIVVVLQVTTPLRTAADIDDAVTLLAEREDAESLVAVTEYQTPPHWSVEIDESQQLEPHFEANSFWNSEYTRSQDVPPLYHPNGAIFAARVDAFRAQQSFYTDATLGYEMPRERSLDIDEPFDLELSRAFYEYQKDR